MKAGSHWRFTLERNRSASRCGAATHAEPDPEWWIVRLMIGQAHQGQGYGHASLIALLARIRERANPPAIFLSFEPHNTNAEALYRSLGFQPTGRVESGEIVYKLDLG